MWEIEFYETESGKKVILDFLESLPVKHRARAIREIELLEEFGTDLTMPHVKQIDGKLWELRIKASSNISRIFYFVSINNKIVLLHGFIKKTNKTPEREKETAKKEWQSIKGGLKHEF